MTIDDFTAIHFYLRTAPSRYNIGGIKGNIRCPIDAIAFYRMQSEHRAVYLVSNAIELLHGCGKLPIPLFIARLATKV